MKITLQEHDNSFTFDMQAETVADAALLARFSINATKEVRGVQTVARRDHSVDSWLEIGKRKDDSGRITKPVLRR